MQVSTAPQGTERAISLYDGGVLTCRPADAPLVYAARARADALVAALSEAGHAVTKAGGAISGVPDLDDPIERQGVWDAMFALSLAELTVTGWEGIKDENDQDLAFSPKLIVHLMRDSRAADLFVGRLLEPVRSKDREKNV